MKVKEALVGDFRKDEVRECVQSKLKQIPALSKFIEGDVPLLALEKTLWKLHEKYGVMMQYIMPSYHPDCDPHYACSFKTKEHKWIGTVHGLTVYEIYAKGVLMCYCYAKKGSKNIQ